MLRLIFKELSTLYHIKFLHFDGGIKKNLTNTLLYLARILLTLQKFWIRHKMGWHVIFWELQPFHKCTFICGAFPTACVSPVNTLWVMIAVNDVKGNLRRQTVGVNLLNEASHRGFYLYYFVPRNYRHQFKNYFASICFALISISESGYLNFCKRQGIVLYGDINPS